MTHDVFLDPMSYVTLAFLGIVILGILWGISRVEDE